MTSLQPSEKEMARRRVEAFLKARKSILSTRGGLDKNIVYSAGNREGEQFDLLHSDLELLVHEEKESGDT